MNEYGIFLNLSHPPIHQSPRPNFLRKVPNIFEMEMLRTKFLFTQNCVLENISQNAFNWKLFRLISAPKRKPQFIWLGIRFWTVINQFSRYKNKTIAATLMSKIYVYSSESSRKS